MRRLTAVIALVLALGACEAGAEIDVKDDGSGTFGFSFFIDKQFLALIEGFSEDGQDPFEEFRTDIGDSPVPFELEEFERDGGRGIRARVPFSDANQLRRFMEDLDEESESGSPSFGDFTLERRGGGWHFETVSEAPDLGDLGDIGGGEGGEDPPFDPSQIASLLKVSFRVTLPGRTVTSTADDVSAQGGRTTFVWDADLTSKEPLEMVATTASAGSGFPVLPVGIGLGAVVLVAGATIAMQRRKAPGAAPGGPGGVVPPVPGTFADPERPPEPPAP